MNLSEYLALPYRVNIIPGDPDEGGWVAVVPDLPGCMTQADDWDELAEMLHDAKRAWISDALQSGDAVPMPTEEAIEDDREYSGRTQLRMPKTLHRDLARAADREGVSLNQWIVALLAGRSAWSGGGIEIGGGIAGAQHLFPQQLEAAIYGAVRGAELRALCFEEVLRNTVGEPDAACKAITSNAAPAKDP